MKKRKKKERELLKSLENTESSRIPVQSNLALAFLLSEVYTAIALLQLWP